MVVTKKITIFEAVPNISEGRDRQKIETLVREISKVKNIRILDYSMDADHHRSVLTYLGTGPAIVEAGFRLVALAKDLIDLEEHQGVHPRVGAVDVLPIVPLSGEEMPLAVELAWQLGAKIKAELQIPVYYYAEAAKDQKYRNLADIRREKYNITSHPSAGALCLGARGFLVAYNINLKTKDLSIGQEIAKVIREKNGGLPGVKALSFYLKSKACVQVSMNLTKPELVSRLQVRDQVNRLAGRHGVEILNDELIGLEPAAVQQAAAELKQELIKRENK